MCDFGFERLLNTCIFFHLFIWCEWHFVWLLFSHVTLVITSVREYKETKRMCSFSLFVSLANSISYQEVHLFFGSKIWGPNEIPPCSPHPLSSFNSMPHGLETLTFSEHIDYLCSVNKCHCVTALVRKSVWVCVYNWVRTGQRTEESREHWIYIDWLLGWFTWEWMNGPWKSFLSPEAVFSTFCWEYQQYHNVSFWSR